MAAATNNVLVNIPSAKRMDGVEMTPEEKALEARYGERLKALDADGDGNIDRCELLRFIDNVVHKETQLRHMKTALYVLLGLLILFAATTFSVVWAVVVLSREVSTQGSTIANTNPALVDKSGATLWTTGGVINLTYMPKNATAAAESFSSVQLNSTAYGRRLLQAGPGSGLVYVRDIDDNDVIAGCQLMLDGQETFTSIAAGVDDTSAVSVTVESSSGNSCQNAVSSSTVADSGRRLLSVGDALHQKITIKFDDHDLECSHEGCELLYHNYHSRALKGNGRPYCRISPACNPFTEDVDGCGCKAKPPGKGACFPADALVTTPAGPKRIDTLIMGEKVLTVQSDGTTSYDDVYFNGHKDATTETQFVKLATTGNASLRLTPDHQIPIIRDGARMVIPSNAARIGDFVHVVGNDFVARLEAIVSKTLVLGVGLYNPYTISGLIVVDGVSASCHSSWIFDGLFEMMKVSLPVGYQAAFAPLRAVYSLVGARRMASVEFMIDIVAERITRENFSMAPLINGLAYASGVMAVFLASRKRLVV